MPHLSCLAHRVIVVITCLVLLHACGGGGGGTLPSTQRPVVDPIEDHIETNAAIVGPPYGSFSAQPDDPEDFDSLVSSFETAEYAGMQGLSLIKASSAYARGANGAGVNLGIIDSGVHRQHVEFSHELGDKVTVVGSDYGGNNQRSNDAISHGTMVAGILAANRDERNQGSFNMHGVAYNANLYVYEIPLQPSDGPYDPIGLADLDFGTDNYFANRFGAMAQEVDIINMSFGFSGLITDYSASSIKSRLGNSLDALRQADRSLGSRAIFVVSAGNGFGDRDEFGNEVDATSPELLPGLPYLFPELQPHMLTVAAADSSGVKASYSNHCGVAANFCLAAPGGGDANADGSFAHSEVIWSTNSPSENALAGNHYYGGSIGTSFAAPMVSGSLALLKQLFPTVGNYELVNRLLVTANKSGIYANSAIYGQGLLDLDAATRPVGNLGSPISTNLDAGLVAPNINSINIMGDALGDAVQASLSQQTMALFDQLGFPFYQPASALVQTAPLTLAEIKLSHASQTTADGNKLLLGLGQDPWRQDFRLLGNPSNRIQADYIALQFRSPQGTERFAGLNANPGWFFGLYGNSVISPSVTEDDSSFAAPWLRYARQGWSSGGAIVTATGQQLRLGLFNGSASWHRYQPQKALEGDGALLEYSLASNPGTAAYGLGIQAGFVREQQSFLGTSISSALGDLRRSETFFIGLNGHIQINPRWQTFAALYQGNTHTGTVSSEIFALGPEIRSGSWALGFSGRSLWHSSDQLRLTISQPLRVETGRAAVTLARGRTIDREVIYQTVPISLQPSGREQRLELGYYLPTQVAQRQAWFSISSQYTQQPYHRARNPDQLSVKLMFSISTD
ncbi:MAG: S8 family peptidase [Porticoccaceae bacterium]